MASRATATMADMVASDNVTAEHGIVVSCYLFSPSNTNPNPTIDLNYKSCRYHSVFSPDAQSWIGFALHPQTAQQTNKQKSKC